MPLVRSKELLLDAQKNHYAVGAFNVENMEMMQAVIAAAEAENAPVILQTTPSTLKYADTSLYSAMAKAVAQKTSVPVAIHLDHGSSAELCEKAAKDGYTSLMIDGSKLALEENIALAKQVVEMAKTFAICPSVEAELGKLGGKEDDLEVKEGEDTCTDPVEAVKFVEESGIDSLAVAIGTAHGFYKGEPKLEFERLAEINKVVSVPLVLHGTSGVSDEDVKKAISLGICKVNFATELRVAYSDAVKAYIANDPTVYDPKKYGAMGREAVTNLVRHRIRICMGK
jgi:tagatose 1,6-diphosphate aldolase GatY/KbaY